MQVIDDIAWQEQLSEFEADDLSRKFRDFLLAWMDKAEELIDSGDPFDAPLGHDGQPILGYARVVSKALEVTEQTEGYLSTEWIGQMLLVMCQHWTHGPSLYEGLTHLEKRMVDQATAIKLAELQAGAAKMSGEE